MITNYQCNFGIIIFDELQQAVVKADKFFVENSLLIKFVTIDNITIDDQVITFVLFQEVIEFFRFGSFGTQMNIGNYYRPKLIIQSSCNLMC